MAHFNLKLMSMLAVAASCHAHVNPEYILHQKEVKATKLGQEVAVYAYPLVSMGLLKQYGTYAAIPEENRAPINQFAHETSQATPLSTEAFSTIDTLSSKAWLDLSRGPLVLHIPVVYKRYYMFELFDGWTNVITTIDSKTSNARNYFITGPDFKGTLPKDMIHLRSVTNLVYIKGVTQCFGPSDYENIAKIQQGYTITPYSKFGTPYTPPFVALKGRPAATREAPHYQLQEINFISYFNRFADMLRVNPPGMQDVYICRTLDELGMAPQENFDTESANRVLENGLEHALDHAIDRIERCYHTVYTRRHHWEMILRKESDFGTDYMRRAYLARACLPMSLSQNILCMTIDCDFDGNRFHGTQKYLYHIPRCELPPVGAFWSLTMYNLRNQLVCNPANIYAIQSFSDNLYYNEDGSVDIWIQQERPICERVNWLPCPNDGYKLMFRLYEPHERAICGGWVPPQLRCLDPFSN